MIFIIQTLDEKHSIRPTTKKLYPEHKGLILEDTRGLEDCDDCNILGSGDGMPLVIDDVSLVPTRNNKIHIDNDDALVSTTNNKNNLPEISKNPTVGLISYL